MWRKSARSLGLACLLLTLPALHASALADVFCGALGHEPCPQNECGALSALKSFFGLANDCNVKVDPCSPGLEVHAGKCMMRASPALPALPPVSGSVTKYEFNLIDVGLDSKPLRYEFGFRFVREGDRGTKTTHPADQYPIVVRLLPGPPPQPGEAVAKDNSGQAPSISVYLENKHILLGTKSPLSSNIPATLTIKRDLNQDVYTYQLNVMNSEDDDSFGTSHTIASRVWGAMNRSADFFDKYLPDGKTNREIDIVFDEDNQPPAYAESYYNFKNVPLISMNKNSDPNNLTFNILSHEYGHKVMGDLYGNFVYSYSKKCRSEHYPDRRIDQNCAFVEGWADFYSISVADDPVFKYAVLKFDYSKDKDWMRNLQDKSNPYDPSIEGFIAHVLWKFYSDAGIPRALFMQAMVNLGSNSKKLNIFNYTTMLYSLADANQRAKMRTLADGWSNPSDPNGWTNAMNIGDKEDLRRSAQTVPDINSFEYIGLFYSNDNFIYDDAGSQKIGSLEDCANWCNNTNLCENFTYSYFNPATGKGACTLFGANTPRYATTSDYKFYHRIK
jgi:hypothetical protein